uniref:RING-type E3 ubiquitin transferase n=1 Tax=Corvus moneduloides TaxID=1196302 RepID=A0A8C3DXV6_CORMO
AAVCRLHLWIVNNQVPLAIPGRGFDCPICLDIIEDETSVSWCRHTFCFPCILEWACIRPVCPICQEPFQYLFRKVGDSNYEVYYTRSPRCNRGRRSHRHSAERRRYHSAGHRQRSSSRRQHGSGHARDWERDRSRSQRQNHDGHSRSQQARSYDHSRSRRWQHSSAQETDPETSRGWDQTSRHEQDTASLDCVSRAGQDPHVSLVCSGRWRWKRAWLKVAPFLLLPATTRCSRLSVHIT